MRRKIGLMFVGATIMLLAVIYVTVKQPPSNVEWWIESNEYTHLIDKDASTQIKVSIIDTGIDSSQPFLKNLSVHRYAMEDEKNSPYLLSHGTEMASLIFDKRIFQIVNKNILNTIIINDIDVGDEKSVSIENLKMGIDKAIELHSDIINISLGTYKDDPGLHESIDKAINQGIIIIASAGDDSREQYLYPASYENVISVSGVDTNKHHLVYNNRNDRITVSAPAENVQLSYSDKKISGSSVAAAFVTNMAIILKYIDSDMSLLDFSQIIEQSSTEIGEQGKDVYYGNGLISIRKAVDFVNTQQLKESVS